MNMDSRFRGNDGKKAEFVPMNMDSCFRRNDGGDAEFDTGPE